MDFIITSSPYHPTISLSLMSFVPFTTPWQQWSETAVEWDTYKELDLRLVHHISSLLSLPIPTPHVLSPAPSLETPVSSPLSIATTLVNTPADTRPVFHQDHTASYPTWVIPRNPHLGPPMKATPETVCFHCHALRHLHVDCPDYECPNCHQWTPGHPQYHCLRNFCSFCWHFSHMPYYCPDQWCALCDDPGHVIANCPFSEDPSSGVIFNNGDPKGIWSCSGGANLQRGYCYNMWSGPYFLYYSFITIILRFTFDVYTFSYILCQLLLLHSLVNLFYLSSMLPSLYDEHFLPTAMTSHLASFSLLVITILNCSTTFYCLVHVHCRTV